MPRLASSLETMRRIHSVVEFLVISYCVLFTPPCQPAVHEKQLSERAVDTKYGRIRGMLWKFPSGHLDPIEVYHGVQYGSIMKGSLRFMPPTGPTESWGGTRVSIKQRPACPQGIVDEVDMQKLFPLSIAEQRSKITSYVRDQSEDCLNLNLYIPTKDYNQTSSPKFPVMVFIHGYSYDSGTGNAYDGSVLASYGNIIVVTLNYRLGVLGFLSTGDRVAPGNYALLDISAALHWLRENIVLFGGDPNSLTLFGHGYGAALVNDLLISPMSRGGTLFQRAILQSGSVLNSWATATNTLECTRELARRVGCYNHTENTSSLISCLRSKTAEQLLNSVPSAPKYRTCFGPISSPFSGALPRSVKSLLTHPLSVFPTASVMFGVTKTEAMEFLKGEDVSNNMTEFRKRQILRTLVHNTFNYQKQNIYEILEHHYTDWESTLERRSNRDNILELLGDGLYVAPLVEVGNYHARSADTYFYVFGYTPNTDGAKQLSSGLLADELPYVFGAPLVEQLSPFQPDGSKTGRMISEAVMTYWSNFAKSGNPNIPADPRPADGSSTKSRFTDIDWPKYTERRQLFLHISKRPKVAHHYRGRHVALWLDLIPKLHKPDDSEEDDDDLENRFDLSTFDEPGRLVDLKNILPYTVIPTTSTQAINVTKSGKINVRAPPTLVPTDVKTVKPNNSKAANKIEYSYVDEKKSSSLPLNLTIAIGCSLLFFNIVVFAGIFYQRMKMRKFKRRLKQSEGEAEGIESSAGANDTRRNPGKKARKKGDGKDKKVEFESINLLSKNDVEYMNAKYKCRDLKKNISDGDSIRLVSIQDVSEKREPYSMQQQPHGEKSKQSSDAISRYAYR